MEKIKLRVIGSKALQEKVEAAILALPLTGIEPKDRILISDYLDGVKGKVSVLYDGNTVYPKKKYLDGLKKMQDTGRLDLTDDMYHFLSQNFDIAHYDRAGFTATYDNSWEKWYQSRVVGAMAFSRIPQWRTDLQRIIDEFEDYHVNGVKVKKPKLKAVKRTVKTAGSSDKAWPSMDGQMSLWDLAG